MWKHKNTFWGEACFVRLNLGGWASSLSFSFLLFWPWTLVCPWSLMTMVLLLCPQSLLFRSFQPHPWRLGGVLFVSMISCVHDPFVYVLLCCPRDFVPQGKLGRIMLPRSPAGCSFKFHKNEGTDKNIWRTKPNIFGERSQNYQRNLGFLVPNSSGDRMS